MEEISVLLSDGRKLRWKKPEYESSAEFSGRILCLIEDRIREQRPLVAGERWAEFYNDGYALGAWNTGKWGSVKEHTGEPYQNRTKSLGTVHTEADAHARIKGGAA